MNENIKVPEGWKVVRLGDVIEEVNERNLLNEDIPILTSSRKGIYFQDEYFNRIVASKDISNYKVIKNRYFTYRSMSDDEVFIFNRLENASIGLVSPAYYVFKVKKEHSGDFLKYFINNSIKIKKQINKVIKGTTRTALKFNQLINFVAFFPPLPEQHKIAEILEIVDNAIEKTDRIIEKYKRIKQGLMQDLLTKGVDENWHIRNEKTHKFKDSPLGRIPEEWEVVDVYGHVNLINGGTPSTARPEFWNGSIPWLSVEDFNIGKRWVFSSSKCITELVLKQSATKLLKKGMLIISARGTVGVVAQLGSDMAFNQSCYGLDAKDKMRLSNDFLYYALKHFITSFLSLAYGNVFNTITRETFKKVLIPLPPLPEQQRIAEILSQIDETIEKEQAYKEKLEGIKKGLMEDLLTGKVRVNNLIEEESVDEIG
jgi:type I restriction enzyme S subunit